MRYRSGTDENLKKSCGEILLTYFDHVSASGINVDKLQEIVSIMLKMDIDLNQLMGNEDMTLLHMASTDA